MMGYGWDNPKSCLHWYAKATEFLAAYPKSPQVRLNNDVLCDAVKGKIPFREFSVLCAVFSIIGREPWYIIRRNRVRAAALGYSSPKALFDKDGNLIAAGISLLESRQDGAKPLTIKQVLQ